MPWDGFLLASGFLAHADIFPMEPDEKEPKSKETEVYKAT